MVGANVNDRREKKMVDFPREQRFSVPTLSATLLSVLNDIQYNTELFKNLLVGYPDRLRAVINDGGG